MQNILKKMKEFSPVAQHVLQHDANGEHGEKVWDTMVLDAAGSGASTKKEYEAFLRPYELEILQARWDDGDYSVKRTTKKGDKWLISKVCKFSTYRANKSAIGTAIENGVPLLDDNGNPRAKTKEVEKDIKATKEVRETSNYEKAMKHAKNLVQIYPSLHVEERAAIDGFLGTNGIS